METTFENFGYTDTANLWIRKMEKEGWAVSSVQKFYAPPFAKRQGLDPTAESSFIVIMVRYNETELAGMSQLGHEEEGGE